VYWASQAKRLLHPVYSPDFTPSDFFLFGYLKEKLTASIARPESSSKVQSSQFSI
jgi:hypothetical protein